MGERWGATLGGHWGDTGDTGGYWGILGTLGDTGGTLGGYWEDTGKHWEGGPHPRSPRGSRAGPVGGALGAWPRWAWPRWAWPKGAWPSRQQALHPWAGDGQLRLRGGALGVLGGSFLLWAGLLLVLLTLDVGLSRDLLRLREHQEGLQESVPRLWQRLEELRGEMEQEERDGWQREVAAQRLGAEVGGCAWKAAASGWRRRRRRPGCGRRSPSWGGRQGPPRDPP
ncbi:uncharacterized protein [Anser cygnoides]|uniref:uncharacterized protein n=1 Tax=Anser cygnoides TaxID=8845 RepID=UPI0034D1581E